MRLGRAQWPLGGCDEERWAGRVEGHGPGARIQAAGMTGFLASSSMAVMRLQCRTVFSHFPAKRGLSRFQRSPIRHWDGP
jgi:hypothetical protein